MKIDDVIKFVADNKDVKCKPLSPKGVFKEFPFLNIFYSAKDIELYLNRRENTLLFAEKLISNLVLYSNQRNRETSEGIKFEAYYIGSDLELPENNRLDDFILNNGEKLVVIVCRDNDHIKRDIFLDLPYFLKLLEDYQCEYEIYLKGEQYDSREYANDSLTYFSCSYNPENIRTLKK